VHKVSVDFEKTLIGVERPPYDGRFWTAKVVYTTTSIRPAKKWSSFHWPNRLASGSSLDWGV
jgi:hypothetical protein